MFTTAMIGLYLAMDSSGIRIYLESQPNVPGQWYGRKRTWKSGIDANLKESKSI